MASIQKIVDVRPLENADRLEVATVLGYHAVIAKGQFQPGDCCVYIECDALLPKENPTFSFTEKYHYRVRIQKLRGQVSMGLCMGLDILPPGNYSEGDDVSEILGITKYDPPVPACISGLVKGNFPSFVYKTDEPRIQNYPGVLERYKGTEFICTEKYDGSSVTAYLKDGEFGVCMRNYELKEAEGNSLWAAARKLNYEEIMQNEGLNMAFQGEIVGSGINGNNYKFKDGFRTIYIFNIFDINEGRHWNHDMVQSFCKQHDLPVVPEVGRFTLNHTVDEMIEMAKGKSTLNDKVHREGIVVRPVHETYDPEIRRLSFKAINPDYLLKYQD